MSRVTSLLIRFIQELDAKSSSIEYIRIKSNNSSDSPAAEIHFVNGAGETWPKMSSLIHEIGFRSGDLIQFDSSGMNDITSDILLKLEKNIKNCSIITLLFVHENSAHQGDIISEIRKHTILGLPKSLYTNYGINSLRIYFGANQIPINLNLENLNFSDVRSNAGFPYLISENETGKIDFIYLNAGNCIKKIHLPIEKYILPDVLREISRFKHTVKYGITIFCFFPEDFFKIDIPLINWKELIDLVNNKAKISLEKMLINQVSAIERRINSISNRRRVFFKGEELGLVPGNEQETVILYERYIAKNNYTFGKVSRLKLLDYSPQGIDSVCSFSVNLNQPTTNVAVEFEYVLQNFFDHGHDPQQVKLILCYSMKKTIFPYDHYGVTFDIDRTGDLPSLVNRSTGSSCYVFALDEVLEER